MRVMLERWFSCSAIVGNTSRVNQDAIKVQILDGTNGAVNELFTSNSRANRVLDSGTDMV